MEDMSVNVLCPSCLTVFEDPCLLACQHALCVACTKARMQTPEHGGHPTILCPECAMETVLAREDGVAMSIGDIPRAGDVQSAVEAFAHGSDLDHAHEQAAAAARGADSNNKEDLGKCPNCDQRTVSVKCVECGPMCKECADQIHKVRIFQNHTIEDAASSPSASVPVFPKCPDHNEENKLYCELCDAMVCHFCLLVGDHKDAATGTPHPCSPGEEAAAKAKARLHDEISGSDGGKRHLQQMKQAKQEQRKEVEAAVAQVHGDIVGHFKELHAEIDRRQQELVDELQDVVVRHNESLAHDELAIDDLVERIGTMEAQGNALANSASVLTVLRLQAHFLKRVRALKESVMAYTSSAQPPPLRLGFVSSSPQLKAALASEGRLQHNVDDEGGTLRDRDMGGSDGEMTPRTARKMELKEKINKEKGGKDPSRPSTPPVSSPRRSSKKAAQPMSSGGNSANNAEAKAAGASNPSAAGARNSTQGSGPTPAVSARSVSSKRASMRPAGSRGAQQHKPVSLPHSTIQLVDSSPDVLHVGLEGMMRFQLSAFDDSSSPCPPASFTNEDTRLLQGALWVEDGRGQLREGESSVLLQGDTLLMAFVPSQEGEHFLNTTLGSGDGSPVCIANFNVEPALPPLPGFVVPGQQKGLEIVNGAMPSVRRSGPGWRVVFMECDFTTEKKEAIFSWEVTINELCSPEHDPHRIVIGITEVSTKHDKIVSKQVLSTDAMWGIAVGSGKKVHKGKEQKILQGIEGFQIGDKLGIVLQTDKDKSTMTLYRNGKSQGVAFRAVPRQSRPVIALTGSGSKVTVTNLVEGANIFEE